MCCGKERKRRGKRCEAQYVNAGPPSLEVPISMGNEADDLPWSLAWQLRQSSSLLASLPWSLWTTWSSLRWRSGELEEQGDASRSARSDDDDDDDDEEDGADGDGAHAELIIILKAVTNLPSWRQLASWPWSRYPPSLGQRPSLVLRQASWQQPHPLERA